MEYSNGGAVLEPPDIENQGPIFPAVPLRTAARGWNGQPTNFPQTMLAHASRYNGGYRIPALQMNG